MSQTLPLPVRRRRPRRGDRPHTKPVAARNVVDGLFAWLDLADQARSYRAMTAFAKAAGPQIGERAQPVALRGSALLIRVTSAAWSLELSMLEKELVARCKQLPGGEPIETLRFTVGALVESATEERRALVQPRLPPRPTIDFGAVISALSRVEDRELREDLGRLITRVCTPP